MDDTDDVAADASDAFEAFGNESRVAILRALVDRRREDPVEPALSFSALRERVGMRDSGQFNYHLDRLRGRFVEETDDGYELTYAGSEVAGAVLSGAFATEVYEARVAVEEPCPVCGTPITATYGDGHIDIFCENEHRMYKTGLPPGTVGGREGEDLLQVAMRVIYNRLDLILSRTCPSCYGVIERDPVEAAPESGVPQVTGSCSRCGYFTDLTLTVYTLFHPAVRAFLYDHGVTVHDRMIWELDFLFQESAVAVVSAEPLRFRVDIHMEGEVLRLTLDGAADVLEAERA